MRPASPIRFICFAVTIASLAAGCSDQRHITEPAAGDPLSAAPRASVSGGTVVNVADLEQLYAAVNNPANAGASIVLAPATYTLSAKDPSNVNRPNGGRLDLQENMSLSGVEGDRAAVVINAAGLPQSSFTVPFGRTGVIRTGRGNNSVQWLTIAGNPLAAAAVETDLFSTAEAGVRVAHVVSGDNARGVDIRNVTAAMAGRRLQAEISDNEFFRGVEGIRILNFMGADNADISVSMSGNRSYMNVVGCIVENNRASFGTIYVRSSGDRFEDNGLGCWFGGGLVQTTGAAHSNAVVFEGHGTDFVNNTRTTFFNNTGPNFTDAGGVLVSGAHSGTAGGTSHNTAVVRLWGCRVTGNVNPALQSFDFLVFGARSTTSGIAGVDNHATVVLQGVSRKIDVTTIDSAPVDPSGSNTTTVIR